MTELQTEDCVKFNSNELLILISALNYLSTPNKVYLQMNFTNVNQLYNKLYSVWETLDNNEKLRNSIVLCGDTSVCD
jgi:hypothetical protein